MSEFENWGLGQIVVFTKYYHLDGVGRKVYTKFNVHAKIADYREEITENGLQYGYIVEDVLNGLNYFVLESDCKLVSGKAI